GFAAKLEQIEISLEEIDGNPEKPSFIKAADLDGDGIKELIVSIFAGSSPAGSGFVAIYRLADRSNMRSWKKTILPGSKGTKFPNAATIADVNQDGKPDIIVPSGFLATAPFNSGQISWYENLGENQWKKHDVAVKQKFFYHHVELMDMNGDGINDMLTVGEKIGATQVQYFAGKGGGVFGNQPVTVFQNALGSLPVIFDLNNDGRKDLLSAQYFV
ncbi:MAG: FG-GAP repeat domain-containing protein, partial [Candidatus Rifleibacteriota bacterium]